MPDDKDPKEPFIEPGNRPTPIDWDRPVADLTMRDLISLIEGQLATGAPIPSTAHEWRKPEKELRKPELRKPEKELRKPEKETIKGEKELRKPEKEFSKPEKEGGKPEQIKPEQLKPEHIKPEDKPFDGVRIRDVVRGVEGELLEAIELLESERLAREPEVTDLALATFEPKDDDTALGLLLPGTVTLFVAPAGSEFLDEVGRVFSSGDDAEAQRLVAFINEQGAHRGRVSPLETARELVSGRSFATLRYGEQTLAENLGLAAGIGFGAISFPYAGQTLDAGAFAFEQYVRHDLQERLDGVLVARPPRLSDAERAALDLIPVEQRFGGIGRPGHLAVTVTTVTIALFVVAVHTPTLTGGRTIDDLRVRLDAVALGAEKLAQIESRATLRQLVALRRDLQAELF